MEEDFDLDALIASIPDIGAPDLVTAVESDFSLAVRSYETALPRGYLSNSQIGLYLKCGRAYEFRYVLGASTPGNSAMAQGSAVHQAADVLHKSMIAAAPISVSDIKDAYADAHAKHFDPAHELVIAEEDADLGAVKDRGMTLVEVYRSAALGQYVPHVKKGEAAQPAPRPLAVVASERVLRTTVAPKDITGEPVHEPVPMMMILDIEEPHAVRDLKVRKKLPVVSEASNSLQLALYSEGVSKPSVSLDVLIKPSATLPTRYVRYETEVTDAARNHATTIVAEVADDIRAGRFRMTSPENWWCSEAWCGYWRACRGKTRG